MDQHDTNCPSSSSQVTNTGSTTTATTTGSPVNTARAIPAVIVVGSLILVVSVFTIIVMVLSAVVCKKTKKHLATSNNLKTLETSNYWQITSENLCVNAAYTTNVTMEINEAYKEANLNSVASENITLTREDNVYWEPAATVNELYRQLSSNKYREIHHEDIK